MPRTEDTISTEDFKQLKKRRKGTDWEGAFIRAWSEAHPGWPPMSQFEFAPPRKWAFDFAWQWRGKQLAVEIEGCTWQKGRHVTGKGYREDCRKYNHAALCRWQVLRYTGDDLKGRLAEVINEVWTVLMVN